PAAVRALVSVPTRRSSDLVPIVRRTGGLKDTVTDIDEPGGYGVTFAEALAEDATDAVRRAMALAADKKRMHQLRKQMMKLDFSWDRSATNYLEIYQNITE